MCFLSSIRQTPPGQVPEHNCFEPVVAWIRASEAEEGVQKVVALAIAFFASLILCVSVVGIPFFLMAHEEYVLQELRPWCEHQVNEIRRLEGEVARIPDSDDGNIVTFDKLPTITVTDIGSETAPRDQDKNTHGAVQTPKAPLSPDQQIVLLKSQIQRLERENGVLKIQNQVFLSAKRVTDPAAKAKTLPPHALVDLSDDSVS